MANIDRKQPKDSPLFLVRVCPEPDIIDAADEGPQPQDSDSRGKVLHVVSGEAYSFNSWAELVTLMQAMISGGSFSAFQAVTLPQDTQDIDQPIVPLVPLTAARESTKSC